MIGQWEQHPLTHLIRIHWILSRAKKPSLPQKCTDLWLLPWPRPSVTERWWQGEVAASGQVLQSGGMARDLRTMAAHPAPRPLFSH